MRRNDLIDYINKYLAVEAFKDYAPNGLQVEGTDEVNRIVLGVTASQALLEQAVAQRADMILVHHGWFWRGEPSVVVGMKKRRLATLLTHNINLAAYHLPLDAHTEIGNNAQLGMRLGFNPLYQTGEMNLVWVGEPLTEGLTASALIERVTMVLDRAPSVMGPTDKPLKKIAWCTGAAQDFLSVALEEGCDAYISGEVSERTFHEAQENDILYVAAGHHATERFGIQALGDHLLQTFPELSIQYQEINNPV